MEETRRDRPTSPIWGTGRRVARYLGYWMSLERVGNGVDFDRSSFERREEIDIFRKRGRSTPRVTISFPNDSLPHTQLPEFRKVPYRITKLYHMYIYIYIFLYVTRQKLLFQNCQWNSSQKQSQSFVRRRIDAFLRKRKSIILA